MNLKQEIKVNPKIATAFIWVFCILGIAHEMILAVTRLAGTFWNPNDILFGIGNSYSNHISADVVALFFRLFIFFAVLFVYSDNKPIKRMTKGLVFVKILFIVVWFISISWWINITMTEPMNTWDYYRDISRISRIIYSTVLITAEIALFVVLIMKSNNKVRTIFIVLLIASLIEKNVFFISDFIFRLTPIPIGFDGFIFAAVSVLYIICFIKAISITNTKYKELSAKL